MKAVALLPQVIVEAGGAPLSKEVMRELAAVRVPQRLSAPNQCELSFHGPVETEPLSPGANLRVVAGEDETSAVLGPSHGGRACLPGRSRPRDARAGLRPAAPAAKEPSRTGTRADDRYRARGRTRRGTRPLGRGRRLWPALAEPRAVPTRATSSCSSCLPSAAGLYPSVRDDVLHLITLEGDGDAVTLNLGEDLFEARVELSGETTCRSVTAEGWDPLRAEAHQATADSPRMRPRHRSPGLARRRRRQGRDPAPRRVRPPTTTTSRSSHRPSSTCARPLR